jgi:hypothetical protein
MVKQFPTGGQLDQSSKGKIGKLDDHGNAAGRMLYKKYL